MIIPKQLQNMKFCKILYKSKKPYEIDWTNKPYSYEEMQQHLSNNKSNYGILTGINNLAILDDDSENKTLIKLYEDNFPETFRCRDHYYFILDGWNSEKIIFFDENTHLGELQGKGQQCVGPNSTHPSGEIYEVKKDLPLAVINYNDFIEVFGKYQKKQIREVAKDFKKTKWEGDNITDIPITSIISLAGMKDVGAGCYQGEHIVHGSTKGMNFRVDSLNNSWYCFRCCSGGGPSELIGVVEGIIDCSQAGPSCFTKEQAQEVINVAREKYGLKKPEIKEPMGWAKSINIRKMAERRGLTNCPNCEIPFDFDEVVGRFSCSCGLKGRIEELMSLMLEVQK